MRWPWKRPAPDPDGLKKATRTLANAQANEPRVAELAETLHRKILDNHFGPKIAAALREEHR